VRTAAVTPLYSSPPPDAGGVDALLRCLSMTEDRQEADTPAVVAAALRALLKLCRSREAATRVVTSGAVQLLYHTMQTNAPVVAVQKYGLAVLWAICRSSPSHAGMLRQSGAAQVASQVARHHHGESDVRGWSAALMAALDTYS
jgi:hypothetical protein